MVCIPLELQHIQNNVVKQPIVATNNDYSNLVIESIIQKNQYPNLYNIRQNWKFLPLNKVLYNKELHTEIESIYTNYDLMDLIKFFKDENFGTLVKDFNMSGKSPYIFLGKMIDKDQNNQHYLVIKKNNKSQWVVLYFKRFLYKKWLTMAYDSEEYLKDIPEFIPGSLTTWFPISWDNPMVLQ